MAGTSEDDVGGMPAIPFLTIDDLRKLVFEKTGHAVERDDPMMVLYVMQGAFLEDYQRLLDRHNQTLTALFEQSVTGWTEGVSRQVEVFSDQLLSQGMQDRMAQLGEHARVAADLVTRTRRLAFWMAGLAALSCVGAAVAVFALFLILR